MVVVYPISLLSDNSIDRCTSRQVFPKGSAGLQPLPESGLVTEQVFVKCVVT